MKAIRGTENVAKQVYVELSSSYLILIYLAEINRLISLYSYTHRSEAREKDSRSLRELGEGCKRLWAVSEFNLQIYSHFGYLATVRNKLLLRQYFWKFRSTHF
jgi:hypothetical protein